MDQERVYQLALFNTPKVGGFLFRQLISYCGSAEKVYQIPKGKLARIPGVGTRTIENILDHLDLDKAASDLMRAQKEGVKVLYFTDKDYPERLRHINDAPPFLFLKGATDLNTNKTVAIVGTRKATAYGKQVVEQIVEGLAEYKATVISGLAYGIDVHAHKKAMETGLNTIAVMASGPNIIYPALHRPIAEKITTSGGLLTEYSFDIKPDGPQFPARNRIIAGISDATIVVEAAERGGALITGELANGYNREVFAVPGNINAEYSRGCNNLIRNHKAHIFTSVHNMAEILNWDIEEKQKKQNQQMMLELDPEERKVIELLQDPKPVPIDELSAKLMADPATLSTLLLNLEFKGVIRSLPGKQYMRNSA